MRTLSAFAGCAATAFAVASCGSPGGILFGDTGGAGGAHATSSGSGTTSSGHGGKSSSTGSSVKSSTSSATGASTAQSSGTGASSAQSSGTGGQGGAVTGSGGTGASGPTSGSGGSPSDGGICPGFKSCAQQGFDCGLAPDGCGDTLFCGNCPTGQTCGATSPNVCGIACTPKTCVDQGFDCGMASDGCGNAVDCGPCPTGQVCGVVTPNVCSIVCTPKTCGQQGFNCGQASDGCGDIINCGNCPTGQTCGGTSPNVCGTVVCTPKTCGQQGFDCGTAGDGCGNMISCGNCPTGQACGVMSPNVCGSIVCTPKTCGQQGFDCGMATDGCGNLINCGTCATGLTCGANSPNVCGVAVGTCPGGGTTSISGTVYAPNGTDPLPGVIVYVPGTAVQPFTPGVSCQSSCSASLSGSPVARATTAADGTFTITNVPSGANIPLVIQKGRWRRQFVVPSVAACTNTALPPTGTSQLRMPRTHTEGDIPLMAFVTGSVDALECMLGKIGVANTELSDPSGTGRVRFYLGAGSPGARLSASTPSETTLWSTQATIDQYDMVYFACQGSEYAKTVAAQQVIINYANAGGRLFIAHYGYVWLYDDAPFSGTATWKTGVNEGVFATDPNTGFINTGFVRGSLLAQWLVAIKASTIPGQVQVGTLRGDVKSVVAPSQTWLTVNDTSAGSNVPLHYSFDTPVGAPPTSQCGRVHYTDFHAEDSENSPTTGMMFPAECTATAGTMTPQEKMVEYMFFDLDDCISP